MSGADSKIFWKNYWKVKRKENKEKEKTAHLHKQRANYWRN